MNAAPASCGETFKVTINYAAGTDEAFTREFTLPAGASLYIYRNGEIIDPSTELFTDPEYTQIHESTGVLHDLVFYIK